MTPSYSSLNVVCALFIRLTEPQIMKRLRKTCYVAVLSGSVLCRRWKHLRGWLSEEIITVDEHIYSINVKNMKICLLLGVCSTYRALERWNRHLRR